MKNMIRTFGTALILFILVGIISGCGLFTTKVENSKESMSTDSNTSKAVIENKDITIGVLYDFLSVESRVRQKNELVSYAKEKGVTLIFQSANGDEKLQLQQAENMISQGVDALVILAQNAEACSSIAKQCKEEKIPFIVTDRLIENTDIDYYVGYDNNSIGYLQVNYVFKMMPKGNYIMISGASTDPNCKIWHDAWIDVTKDAVAKGDIKIIADEKCDNWDPNNALKYTENALTVANDKIDVALVMNDGLGTGVNQALEARGLSGKVLMTGLDGETVAFQRIAEKKQIMTILVDDVKTARAIVDTAISAVKGETAKTNGTVDNKFEKVPSVLVDLIPVDEKNLLEIIKLGYSDFETIYKNVPVDQRPKQ